MQPRPSYFALRLFAAMCFFAIASHAYSQENLRNDAAFFQKKVPEYQQWLHNGQLDNIFRADSIAVGANKVTLFLCPAHPGPHVCDSLQTAWNQLESANYQVNGAYFHERLLHKWAFLAEIREEQAEIVVRCHDPAHFYAKISSESGHMPVEGFALRSASVVRVAMPTSLENINMGDNKALLPNQLVGPVCTKARLFLVQYYSSKGTPILWKAKIDDSYSFYDEFQIEVSYLSNEIIQDGYFEYHRIYFKGIQKGNDVEISWDFQGKYGSGILFPPRKNDYKDMEPHYKSELEAYQYKLFRKLLDYLRQ